MKKEIIFFFNLIVVADGYMGGNIVLGRDFMKACDLEIN